MSAVARRSSPVLAVAGLLAAWAGCAAAQTPPARDSLQLALSPTHYELAVRLDFEERTLAGTARITVRNGGATPASVVPLLLYRLMDVDSARVGGAPAAIAQRVVRFTDFPQLQVLAATVTPATPIPPGASADVEVHYHGYLLGYAETGMAYVRDHIDPDFTILRDDAFAFPKPGVPSMDALRRAPPPSYDYVVRITVPDSLVVVNAGRLVERNAGPGELTYVYRSVKPSWRMDFAIGHYGILRDGPLSVAYLAPDSAGARRVLGAARRSLDLFRGWFGPLPGEPALTIIEIEDGYGSQTDVAAIIQSAAAFRDSTRDRELYHEVSHLWNPPDTDRPSPRWNEGLASFLEDLAEETLSGRAVVRPRAERLLAWLRDIAPRQPQLTSVPLAEYGRAQLTDYSYGVGALFFHLLYDVAGPQRFRTIIGGYSQRYTATGGSTRDFAAYATSAAGMDLTPLFRDWFFTTNWWAAVRGSASYDELVRRYRPAR